MDRGAAVYRHSANVNPIYLSASQIGNSKFILTLVQA